MNICIYIYVNVTISIRRNKEGIHLNIQDHIGDGLLQAWAGAGAGLLEAVDVESRGRHRGYSR